MTLSLTFTLTFTPILREPFQGSTPKWNIMKHPRGGFQSTPEGSIPGKHS